MSNQLSEEIKDTLEMLGKGYEPTIEIEQPRKVTERRGDKLVEAERSAFVKIYTSFKKELKELDGNDLKVWIYLALSINRHTKDARPGLRIIAADCDLAVNTVRSILERLEKRGLLDVEKGEGKSNIYRPSDYVSVSKFDTVKTSTVSKNGGTVSKKQPTVSTTRRDFAQLEELEELEDIYIPDPVFAALENLQGGLNSNTPRFVDTWREKHTDTWILNAVSMAKEKGAGIKYVDTVLIGWEANGYPKTREEQVLDRRTEKDPTLNSIQESIKKHFKLTPDWTSKYNESFLQWIVREKVTTSQIEKAASIWSQDKRFNWQVPSLKSIQEHWLELTETVTETHIDYKKDPEAYNNMVLEKIKKQTQGVGNG